MSRFGDPESSRPFFASLTAALNDEPHDAGLIVIDLMARMVLTDSTASSAGPTGYLCYDDEQDKEIPLRYHLADDWLFIHDRSSWRKQADERRRELASKPVLNARAVFYGRPLLEHIAREVFAACSRSEQIITKLEPDEYPYETPETLAVRKIHADWLLTAREDLNGACPREVAMNHRNHIGWDMQDRCDQWSREHKCPRGLEETSHAFLYGGFGIHELVMYYEMVRDLIWSCWNQLTELKSTGRLKALTITDFVADELPRLEAERETWLDTPNPEFRMRTPRSIIHRERIRLPEAMTGHEAIVDPDCPCCQMQADMPGPVFWGLDGCNMDDDFAFDIYRRTRQEWEQEQREREEFDRKFNAEWAERKRLGVTSSNPNEDGSNALWSRSINVANTPDVPLGIRVFGVGCRLAELISLLREGSEGREATPESQQHIDRLNRDFGNLRELLLLSEPSISEALIDPVLDRFTETLTEVAAFKENLTPQCENLSGEIRKLLEPASAYSEEGDIPF
ncbi:MAG: hypothetical protein QM703_04220 [Gemmatales bacterium]